ncbi:hypothetical protein M0R04_09990 [Candidatus Dojkabacteria bacterium]|jgi:hypothetical protein|nr:hypothetical protein [Candidatus Dojkabacteria bacterium]
MDPKSVTDKLKSMGKDPSLQSRMEIGKQYGIDYSKSKDLYATENEALLAKLNTGGTVGEQTNGGAQPYALPKPTSGIVGTSDSVQRTAEEEARKALADKTAKDQELIDLKKQKEIQDLKTTLTPETPVPTKPDYLKTYQELRDSQGVQSIEDEMLAIKDKKRELQDSLIAERGSMTGVSEGFAQGTLSEKGQQINDELAKLTRAEQLATDRLNLKNSYIDDVMKFTEADYTTASTQWNNEYAKNIQSQSLIANIQNKYESLADKDQTIARANINTITNLFSNSGKTWDSVDPMMKAQIQSLELQAGIPVGTTEAFAKSKPRANIISTSTGYDASGNQFVRYQYTGEDGMPGAADVVYTGGKAQTQMIPGGKEETGTYSTVLTQYTDDAYKGIYKTREQVVSALQSEFPNVAKSTIESNVKNRLPDGWESNVKKDKGARLDAILNKYTSTSTPK